MRTAKWILCASFGCLFFLVALPAQADGLSNEYAVAGTMTFTGTNACAPSPCTETLNFSFDWQYTAVPGGPGQTLYAGSIVPGATNVALVGGAIDSGFVTSAFIGPGYLGFSSPSTLFDTFVQVGLLELTPAAPQFAIAEMYGCATAACSNDFFQAGYGRPLAGPIAFGTLAYTDTPVPEPSTLALLALGLLALALPATALYKPLAGSAR